MQKGWSPPRSRGVRSTPLPSTDPHERYALRYPGRVAKDDGAFAYYASQVMKIVPWIENIQRTTRQDLANGRCAQLRPWEHASQEIRDAYDFLIGPGQARSGEAETFHPLLRLLGSELLLREAVAGFGNLVAELSEAIGDDKIEAQCREQLFHDPPMPLMRAGLDAFLAIRAEVTVDHAGYALAVEPLRDVFKQTFGADLPASWIVAFMGVFVLWPYVVVRVNKVGRPGDRVWRTFHRFVTEFFEREMPEVGRPGPDDLSDLWRAFDDRDKHKKSRAKWVDRLELLKGPDGDLAPNMADQISIHPDLGSV